MLMQVLPGLLESLFRPPMSGPGLQLYINAYNTIWVFVFVCVAYAVVRCRPTPQPHHTDAHIISLLQALCAKCVAAQLEFQLCLLACLRGASAG